MLRRTILSVLVLLSAATVWGQGEYYRVHPLTGQPVPGRLGEITKDKVVLQTSPTPKEFQVNEIKYVQLPGEPRELMEARNAALDDHYDQVLEWLNKIPPPQLGNEVIRQDAEYYRTLASARLAMAGVGDARAVGTALIDYLKANKNSYHFYEANEAAGDLLVAIGRSDQAPAYYNELANAPWPDYKMRAAAALGRVLQAQGKQEEALRQFDRALSLDAKGKAAGMQMLGARVGKAKSLAELGRAQEAVQLLNQAIEDAPAENNLLYASAYNALGNAYLKLKQPQDALYAFLHVDLLYNQSPDQHAEALSHLKDLWAELGKPQRAKEAAEALKTKYSASPRNK